MLYQILLSMRPKQWVKNSLVFAGIVFSCPYETGARNKAPSATRLAIKMKRFTLVLLNSLDLITIGCNLFCARQSNLMCFFSFDAVLVI